MTTFAQVRDSRVKSHFTKDCTLVEAKAMFKDIASELYEAPADVQGGWQYVNGVFGPYTPSADEQRHAEIDSAINTDSRISQLKAMTNAQLANWWSGLTNAQRNDVIFLMLKVLIRRVL